MYLGKSYKKKVHTFMKSKIYIMKKTKNILIIIFFVLFAFSCSSKKALLSELNWSGGSAYLNGEPFSGYVFEMWDNKSLKYESDYKEGKQVLRYEAEYENGNLSGYRKTYHKNGKIKDEENYVDGKKEGKFTSYNSDGTIEKSKTFKNNLQNGEYIFYSKGKKSMTGTFKDDIEIGERLTFSENTDIINSRIKFIEGVMTESKYYFENGKLKKECYRTEAILLDCKCYTKDGNLLTQCPPYYY